MTLYYFGPRMRRHMMERMMQEPDWDDQPARTIWFPVNIKAEQDSFVITALLPGVQPDDLNIQVINEAVTISGELKELHEENTQYILEEIPGGRFSRTFSLPMPVDANQAEASMENGLLTLRVAKAETARTRTIKVNTK